MAFAFAKKNGEETGWDPTVESFERHGVRKYIFNVGEKRYETKFLLDEVATDSIIGRGTRVYVVFEVGKPGIYYVLKDYWKDEDRSLEGVIVEELLTAVRAKCGEAAVTTVQKHMVTIEEEVLVKVDGRVDHTLGVMMRGADPKSIKWEKLVKVKGKYCYISQGHTQSLVGPATSGRFRQRKITRRAVRRLHHCRVVYKEYATPIHKLELLSDVIIAIDGVTEGTLLGQPYRAVQLIQFEKQHFNISTRLNGFTVTSVLGIFICTEIEVCSQILNMRGRWGKVPSTKSRP